MPEEALNTIGVPTFKEVENYVKYLKRHQLAYEWGPVDEKSAVILAPFHAEGHPFLTKVGEITLEYFFINPTGTYSDRSGS